VVYRSHSCRSDDGAAHTDRHGDDWQHSGPPQTDRWPIVLAQLAATLLFFPEILHGNSLPLRLWPPKRASGCYPLLHRLIYDWHCAEKVVGLHDAGAVRDQALRTQNAGEEQKAIPYPSLVRRLSLHELLSPMPLVGRESYTFKATQVIANAKTCRCSIRRAWKESAIDGIISLDVRQQISCKESEKDSHRFIQHEIELIRSDANNPI